MITRFLKMIAVFAVAVVASHADEAPMPISTQSPAMLKELSKVKDRIVYESYRDTSFELILMNADGSNAKNITNTPEVNEIYPQASPDGKMIAFESFDNTSSGAVRIEVINTDGSDRHVVVKSGRQMGWSPDGSKLAYVVPDPTKNMYSINLGLHILDVKTGQTTRWSDGKEEVEVINPYDGTSKKMKSSEIRNLINLTWSADSKWIMASIVATMGVGQSIVAIEVNGNRVSDLLYYDEKKTLLGCRPNIAPDGTKVTWAVADISKLMWIDIADVDFSGVPKTGAHQHLVKDEVPIELYHPDWSPDSRYIVYSRGVRGNRMKPAFYVPGQKAPKWNICILDPQKPGTYVQITHDTYGNKEPEWVPAAK